MGRCAEAILFPSRQRAWRQGLLRARPRHAEDQRASDRGETAPPSAPARARSVNTYARPSPHGNIRASRAHSLICSAHWHARPLGRRRPGRAGCAAAAHHQAGARPPAARRSSPRSPASQSCASQLHKQAHNRVQHTAHTGGARAAHADTHAHPTRTRAQHARVTRQRSAAHRAHWPTAAAAVCHNPHLTHARAHSPLPAHALGVAERNQLV